MYKVFPSSAIPFIDFFFLATARHLRSGEAMGKGGEGDNGVGGWLGADGGKRPGIKANLDY